MLGHLPVVRDDGGNETGHGPGRWVRKRVQRRRERERADGSDFNAQGETQHALGNEFRAKHVAKRGSNLKVGRVENYRDETSVRVRKGRDGLGE